MRMKIDEYLKELNEWGYPIDFIDRMRYTLVVRGEPYKSIGFFVKPEKNGYCRRYGPRSHR